MILSSYSYIPVNDRAISAAWYEKYLGFKVILEDDLYYDLINENGVRIMLLPNGDGANSQMDFPSGQQAAYGFVVDNIEEIRARFIADGIKVGELFDYNGKSFSFYDPDGNKIELWEIS